MFLAIFLLLLIVIGGILILFLIENLLREKPHLSFLSKKNHSKLNSSLGDSLIIRTKSTDFPDDSIFFISHSENTPDICSRKHEHFFSHNKNPDVNVENIIDKQDICPQSRQDLHDFKKAFTFSNTSMSLDTLSHQNLSSLSIDLPSAQIVENSTASPTGNILQGDGRFMKVIHSKEFQPSGTQTDIEGHICQDAILLTENSLSINQSLPTQILINSLLNFAQETETIPQAKPPTHNVAISVQTELEKINRESVDPSDFRSVSIPQSHHISSSKPADEEISKNVEEIMFQKQKSSSVYQNEDLSDIESKDDSVLKPIYPHSSLPYSQESGASQSLPLSESDEDPYRWSFIRLFMKRKDDNDDEE
jgi:hypothetical protein